MYSCIVLFDEACRFTMYTYMYDLNVFTKGVPKHCYDFLLACFTNILVPSRKLNFTYLNTLNKDNFAVH